MLQRLQSMDAKYLLARSRINSFLVDAKYGHFFHWLLNMDDKYIKFSISGHPSEISSLDPSNVFDLVEILFYLYRHFDSIGGVKLITRSGVPVIPSFGTMARPGKSIKILRPEEILIGFDPEWIDDDDDA